jgi:hypothetical protein
MEDRRLDRTLSALRELPRIPASPGFTTRLLARLDGDGDGDGDEKTARRPLWPRLALPGAVLAALFAGLVWTQQTRTDRVRSQAAEARALLEEIRQEHGRLEDDLQALAEQPSVVYLGGDDELDLVVDLDRVPRAERAANRRY